MTTHHTPLTSFQKENQTRQTIGGYVEIGGHLDLVRFETALRRVIQGYDQFHIVSDGTTQSVDEYASFPFQVREFSTSSQALTWLKQEFAAPFPEGILFQFVLCRVPNAGDYWLKKYQAWLLDDHSAMEIVKQVAKYYRTLQTEPLPCFSPSYTQQVEAEHAYFCSEQFWQDQKYWEHHFVPHSSFPKKINASKKSEQTISCFSPSFYSTLYTFSEVHHCPPLQVILAFLYSYLTFVTQRKECVIGFPYRQPSQILGPLTTTLWVQFHYDTTFSFLEVVKQMGQDLNEAFEHVHVAFTELMDKPIQSDAYVSLADFSKQINFIEHPAQFISLSQFPQGPLSILQSQHSFQFVYSLEVFNAMEVEWITARFETLLEDALSHPQRPLQQLCYLSETERRQLLHTFNNTVIADASQSIHQLFEKQVECTPDAIAVVFQEQSITYHELNQKANRLAHCLQTLVVKAKSLVAVYMERSVEMVIGLLGILKAGGTYLALDPESSDHHLQTILKDAQINLVLTQEKWLEKLPPIRGQMCLDTPWDEILHLPETNLISYTTPHHLAYIYYTFDSTDLPRKVEVDHQTVVNRVNTLHLLPPISQPTFLHLAPLVGEIATFEIWGSLLNGAKLVMIPHQFSPNELRKTIEKHQVTTLWLEADLFHLMIDEQLTSLTSLRKLSVRGGSLSLPHICKALATLTQCQLIYGDDPPKDATLTTCFSLTQPILKKPSVPMERPFAHTPVYVLNAHLQLMPIGVPGELYVGGNHLTKGHLNHLERTMKKLIAHPFVPGEQLYKTGDLARWLPHGHLECLGHLEHHPNKYDHHNEWGRMDNEWERMEITLQQHPDVQHAILVPREDQHGIPYFVVYLTTKQPKLDAETYLALWQALYQQTYSQAPQEEVFNITGWNSSYTQQPIPKAEMEEWVEHTVTKIMFLQPHCVLEIGCGMGLLLSRIAPHCQTYIGTDFAPLALEHVRALQRLAEGKLDHVVLSQRLADQFSGWAPQSFDTIVMNSVVQHFPNVEYLLRVLQGALQVLKPKGYLFIGDVRNLVMLETYYTSIHTYQASEKVTCAQLRRKIQEHVAQEEELVLAPLFFMLLQQLFPVITHVQVQPKRGRYHNELTRFRYEATLYVHHPIELAKDITWITWSGQSLVDLRELFSKHPNQILGIRGIPNARLHEEQYIMRWLQEAEDEETVASLRDFVAQQPRKGIEPDDIWDLAQELPCHVEISWLNTTLQGEYDVVLTPHSLPWRPAQFAEKPIGQAWYNYATNPLQDNQQLIPQLRQLLKDQFPDSVLPKAFTILDKMPMNQHGQVDRQALAHLPNALESEAQHVTPKNELEQTLTHFWGEILGNKRGIPDDFLKSEGNALKGMVLFHKFQKQFNHYPFQLADLFAAPTVAQLINSSLQKPSHHEAGKI